MSSTVQFPEQKLDIQDVANECARRVLQLEAGPIREVAREAAKKAPIRLVSDAVSIPTGDAVDALKLDARVLEALREALGEERFRGGRDVMGVIDNALIGASNDIAREAIEERVRELSEPDGTPIVEPSMCED